MSDDGVGFDPNATLDDKNQLRAGLGLFSIQERLVALLGGQLDIQSAPGKGSQFTLTLPRTGLPRLAADATKAQRHDTLGRNVWSMASQVARRSLCVFLSPMITL